MKPILVFLHGLGGSVEIWDRQRQHFDPYWQTFAWQAPGYGGRALADPLTFEHLSDLLWADLDTLGFERVVLVGHSLGGMLAQTAVAQVPLRVSALVLASTSPAFGDPTGEFQKRFLAERLDPLDRNIAMAEMAGPAAASMAGDTPDREGLQRIEAAMAQTPPDTFRAYVQLLTTFDARATLAAIDCPTLVIVGEHDKAAPPIVSEKMAQKVRNARFVLAPGAGHLLPFEQPDAFNVSMEQFLVESGIGA
ncbi:pimeloyl-ACP methyl ester carboxylesterase [Rhodoligotrophos appendicifer]|uniref:alpha/beta fold hydrolase n=1 Tax=Rhodoligotrophos appendicifer TaxID=987056 RepID=UPI001185AF93|nr:alpha/beta fold hydrolase [Rhodoligotrophos appendicifer]